MCSRYATGAILTVAAIAAGCPAMAEAPATVIQGEYAFDRAAQEKGVRAAFLEFMATDSHLCVPAPASAIEVVSQWPEHPASTLHWHPARTDTATSGDLAYNIGPWHSNDADGKATGFGTFFSMWHREGNGTWRVVLDCGIRHAQPRSEWAPVKIDAGGPPVQAAASPSISIDAWRDPVAAAETRFAARVAAVGAQAAFAEFASPDIVVLYAGEPPAMGTAAASALLKSKPGATVWQSAFTRDSSDGLLGYAVGFLGTDAARPQAAYVHAWRKADRSQPWRLVVQIHQPLPADHAGG